MAFVRYVCMYILHILMLMLVLILMLATFYLYLTYMYGSPLHASSFMQKTP